MSTRLPISLTLLAVLATTAGGCAMKRASGGAAPSAGDAYAANKPDLSSAGYAYDAVAQEAADGEGAAPDYEPVSEDSYDPVAPAPSAPPPAMSKKAEQSAGVARVATSVGTPAVAPVQPQQQPQPTFNTEGYDHIAEREFLAVADKPLSTFSIDVDTASYSNVRRFLTGGSLPPADAVRVEEMINYFSYSYPEPRGSAPFSVTTEVADCPWDTSHRLVHVGVKGKSIDKGRTPPRNLVFLLDVSGSMNSPDKLPLLKQAMSMMVSQLDGRDRVSIVVYAGASGVVLSPTAGNDKRTILEALARLESGGSTNGGDGIKLAYKLAEKTFLRGGINRVILATDGDFNVGVTSRGALDRLIERKRKSGVFLSVLGFGTGNLKDSQMESLADKGNGNYAYIDSAQEARKVLVEEIGSTLVTIAKDVKIQVEFNPAQVASYRLIGYENRALADRDFNDDTKDAGEIGAGHTVTALYEVVPVGAPGVGPGVDPLRYQEGQNLSQQAASGELMHLKLRYKKPQGLISKLVTFPVRDHDRTLAQSSTNFRFSAAVAEFGMLLRGSEHAGESNFQEVYELARGALGPDPGGYRKQFLDLVKQAANLRGATSLAVAR